jgi:hypothetical protein
VAHGDLPPDTHLKTLPKNLYIYLRRAFRDLIILGPLFDVSAVCDDALQQSIGGPVRQVSGHLPEEPGTGEGNKPMGAVDRLYTVAGGHPAKATLALGAGWIRLVVPPGVIFGGARWQSTGNEIVELVERHPNPGVAGLA